MHQAVPETAAQDAHEVQAFVTVKVKAVAASTAISMRIQVQLLNSISIDSSKVRI